MENNLAGALLDFYQKILKPEFDAIKGKLAEHDERFSEILGLKEMRGTVGKSSR